MSALGFTGTGIAAGSAAAATQSAGVLGLGLTTKAIIGTVGAVVGGAAGCVAAHVATKPASGESCITIEGIIEDPEMHGVKALHTKSVRRGES